MREPAHAGRAPKTRLTPSANATARQQVTKPGVSDTGASPAGNSLCSKGAKAYESNRPRSPRKAQTQRFGECAPDQVGSAGAQCCAQCCIPFVPHGHGQQQARDVGTDHSQECCLIPTKAKTGQIEMNRADANEPCSIGSRIARPGIHFFIRSLLSLIAPRPAPPPLDLSITPARQTGDQPEIAVGLAGRRAAFSRAAAGRKTATKDRDSSRGRSQRNLVACTPTIAKG